MYAGHLGFALGTYSFRRTIPLWLLLVAAQLPDWFDAGMCIANQDRGPYGLYTHGFYVIAGASLAAAAFYTIFRRDTVGGFVIGFTVVSHYALDYLTGQKPTWPGGPIIGLQLYNRPVIDLVLEGATILIGWFLYRRTLPRDVRNDGMVYAILFALLALQIIAGLAFFLNLGGQMKC
jgi:hypothetical protein